MQLESSVAALTVGLTIFTLAFSFNFYTQNNYLTSQQTLINSSLQQESTAISNLVQQESTFSSVLSQENSVVSSLSQSVTNLNQAQQAAHTAGYVHTKIMTVDYAGTNVTMQVANVTGFSTLEIYMTSFNAPSIYFAQNMTGPYFVVDCTAMSPNLCNSGGGNSVVQVAAWGNFVGITGMSSSVTTVTVYETS